MKKRIAVTGANGQLGKNLQNWVRNNPSDDEWIFYNSAELNINDTNLIREKLAAEKKIDYLINCAAFTAVDLAETKREQAEAVNHFAVEELAKQCKISNITFIHISTDFVFGGEGNLPLKETDNTQPVNFYGLSKLKGEEKIRKYLDQHFILRTGWLYSATGKNFFKTIQKLGREKSELNIIYDQIGTPTHVSQLIRAILAILQKDSKAYGIYHIANEGVASWYDFAYEILKLSGCSCQLNPIRSETYPTPAKRPSFSVLDKTKFKKEFDLNFPHWQEDLSKEFE